jgi:hypothetical protein
MTDEELDQQYRNRKKLLKIGRLKDLLREKRQDKSDRCGPESCAYVGYVGSEMRVAGVNNKRYKAGQHHRVCADCRKREKSEMEIPWLKHDLGIKV